MKIYISGPMNGIKDFNFPMFDRVAAEYRRLGYEVFSPADNDRKLFGTNDISEITKKSTYRECLAEDVNWICKHAEIMVMLPGWEKSKGALIEWSLANCLDIPIHYWTQSSAP